jgi:hypothetical protein
MTTTEKKHSVSIDPGYLMLALYILIVTALVLFGWFGPAGAGAGTQGDSLTQESNSVRQLIEQVGY